MKRLNKTTFVSVSEIAPPSFRKSVLLNTLRNTILIKKVIYFLFVFRTMSLLFTYIYIYIYIISFQNNLLQIDITYANVWNILVFKTFLKCISWFSLDLAKRFSFNVLKVIKHSLLYFVAFIQMA